MTDAASLLMYLSAFSFSGLLMYYGTKRRIKPLIFLSILVPILLASFRYGVGTDYFNYTAIYNTVSQLSLPQFLSTDKTSHEVGFFAIVKLSRYVSHNYPFMFALSSALTVLFFYLGLRRYKPKHPALIYFLYLTTIFPVTLNAVRQGIAMSICFYALTFLIDRKPKKYIFWFVIASLFHTSVLLLLPLYFLNKLIPRNENKANYKTLAKLMILALIILAFLPKIFGALSFISLFDRYTTYEVMSEVGNNYTFYLKAVITGIILLFYRRLVLLNKNNIYFIAFVIIDLALSTLGFTSSAFNRITLYLSIFNLILLAGIIDIFGDRLGRFFARTLIVSYGFLYFVIAYYSLGLAHIFPYQFINGNL